MGAVSCVRVPEGDPDGKFNLELATGFTSWCNWLLCRYKDAYSVVHMHVGHYKRVYNIILLHVRVFIHYRGVNKSLCYTFEYCREQHHC